MLRGRRRLPGYAKRLGRDGLVRIFVSPDPGCFFDVIIRGSKMRDIAPESRDYDDPRDSSLPNIRRALLLSEYIPVLFRDYPEARGIFAHYIALLGARSGWQKLGPGIDFRVGDHDQREGGLDAGWAPLWTMWFNR